MNLIQIQAISAKNKPLHAYLKSIGLNRQASIFFSVSGKYNTSDIIMLSDNGYLLRFTVKNGKCQAMPFKDNQLFADALKIVEQYVESGKYPYYEENLRHIKHSLNLVPNSQRLF